jgi:hypothetical protein
MSIGETHDGLIALHNDADRQWLVLLVGTLELVPGNEDLPLLAQKVVIEVSNAALFLIVIHGYGPGLALIAKDEDVLDHPSEIVGDGCRFGVAVADPSTGKKGRCDEAYEQYNRERNSQSLAP